MHLFIEEPELSLYPDNQTALIDFLVERCFHHGLDYQVTLMMATHSPYIVNYLNLLTARHRHASQGVASLSADDVDVYLVAGGTLTRMNIEDNGTDIIDTSVLSDPIAEIYNEYNSLVK